MALSPEGQAFDLEPRAIDSNLSYMPLAAKNPWFSECVRPLSTLEEPPCSYKYSKRLK